MSKLYFKYAVMNSAKSAELLIKAHQFEERKIPFLCLKSSIDERDGKDIIKSRIGISRPCVSIDTDVDLFKFMKDYEVEVQLQGYDIPKWLLVDECQFLTDKQVNQLSYIVDELDINVMCFGLRTDFTTSFFKGSKRLMEIADNIDEIVTTCSCGRKAVVNARIDDDGNVIEHGDQIMIGGNDKYVTLCRKCYHKALEKTRTIKETITKNM